MAKVTVGARVMVLDGSEANGDRGTVQAVQDNGIVLVELDGTDGTLWPVDHSEIDVLVP